MIVQKNPANHLECIKPMVKESDKLRTSTGYIRRISGFNRCGKSKGKNCFQDSHLIPSRVRRHFFNLYYPSRWPLLFFLGKSLGVVGCWWPWFRRSTSPECFFFSVLSIMKKGVVRVSSNKSRWKRWCALQMFFINSSNYFLHQKHLCFNTPYLPFECHMPYLTTMTASQPPCPPAVR